MLSISLPMYFLPRISPRDNKQSTLSQSRLAILLFTLIYTFGKILFNQTASVISSPKATHSMLRGSRLPWRTLNSEVLSHGTEPTSDFVLCIHKVVPDLRIICYTDFLYFPSVLQPLIPTKEKEIHMLKLRQHQTWWIRKTKRNKTAHSYGFWYECEMLSKGGFEPLIFI